MFFKNHFFPEMFLLRLLLALVMASSLSSLYKRPKQALPTCGSSRAHTPTLAKRWLSEKGHFVQNERVT